MRAGKLPGLTVNLLGCRRRIGDGVRKLRLDVTPTLSDGSLHDFSRTSELLSWCLTAF